MAAATADEPTLAAMMNALFLVAPPESLFRPAVAWQALRRGRDRSDQPVGRFEADAVPALPTASVAAMR
jgi:hypothetical protein